jgi:hypothetical protein
MSGYQVIIDTLRKAGDAAESAGKQAGALDHQGGHAVQAMELPQTRAISETTDVLDRFCPAPLQLEMKLP